MSRRHKGVVVGADDDDLVDVFAQLADIATSPDKLVKLRERRKRAEEPRHQDEPPDWRCRPSTVACMTRSSLELANVVEPAWPDIVAVVSAHGDARAMPVDRGQGMRVLEALQVTARSPLGALALNCGGLIADHGWFRIFGGGAAGIPDLASVNALPDSAPPPYVAQDVLGGQFAVDGGGLGLAPGVVCYFGPDTLEWQELGIGHGEFVFAAVAGELAEMFTDPRWPGWEREASSLSPDQGISLLPPPFSLEGQNIEDVRRRPVPLEELVQFYADAATQLN